MVYKKRHIHTYSQKCGLVLWRREMLKLTSNLWQYWCYPPTRHTQTNIKHNAYCCFPPYKQCKVILMEGDCCLLNAFIVKRMSGEWGSTIQIGERIIIITTTKLWHLMWVEKKEKRLKINVLSATLK